MSWVVGVGVGAGVNVVVKKKPLSKKKMIIKIRQKVVKFIRTSPIPLSRGQQSKQANPLVQTDARKGNSVHHVNL